MNFPDFRDDLAAVVSRAADAGIGVINVGTDLAMSERAVSLAHGFPDMWAAVGIHPHHAADVPAAIPRLRELAADPKVVAIGEIGLDYYGIRNKESGIRGTQGAAFRDQIDLALKVDRPIIVHCRPSPASGDAYTDTFRILHSYFLIHNSNLRGVAHSFSGAVDEARAFLELGLYIGFTGVITFKNTEALREVVRFVPLGRILVETDAPFLAPEPNRGKRNEPAWVELVARKIAEIKNEPIGRVAEMTTENARMLFKIG